MMAARGGPAGAAIDVPMYEAPELIELGGVVDLTNGTAADDTADMATAKYW
ncbi:hypothetical protein C8D88_111101 [Lentzea atacamensis]|uniref:Uncharacterized protein n=1 Tax=Lentzea atacamensis TaxID=531938 RepID=A0A316HRY3_9PSEU|nr:lasso RiPP family leader peptide-containing protein [Lentzea atacamensis]PWK83216.1 hypothetical protein C8D88_111101 [Lentzea atacamensis]